MQAVAPVVKTTLITCEYNPAQVDNVDPSIPPKEPGLGWVIMHDNTVLAWIVNENGVEPVRPIILGSLPVVAPTTDPVLSPQWAARDGWEFMVPDMVRGAPSEFFSFIATNGGASRAIYANFSDAGLIKDFDSWGRAHPELRLTEKPQ